MPPRAKTQSTSFIKKLFEDSFQKLFTFVFSTLLVSASGYLLFEYSIEKAKLKQEKLEADTANAEMIFFMEMSDVFHQGWFYANEKDILRKREIMMFLSQHPSEPNEAERYELMKIAANSLPQVQQEAAKISGYLINRDLAGGLPSAIQQDIIDMYSACIGELKMEEEVFARWETWDDVKRLETIITISDLMQNQIDAYGKIKPKKDQLIQFEYIEAEKFEEKQREFNVRDRNLSVKRFISITGIILAFLPYLIIYIRSKRKK